MTSGRLLYNIDVLRLITVLSTQYFGPITFALISLENDTLKVIKEQ